MDYIRPLWKPKHRPIIHRLALPWLLITPGLFAIAALALLFVQTAARSDLNIPALWSQCHAREKLPALSRIPGLGTPSCFLVSFFQFANESVRSFARMSAILSLVGGLLTVSLIESARMCNKTNWIISKPTLPWLVFNLAGGALVWDLVIVPAFIVQDKEVQEARQSHLAERVRDIEPEIDVQARGLQSQVETWAIPISVAVGFYVPSLVMLIVNSPATIAVWLFFPVWVAVIRYVVKFVAMRIILDPEPYHLESHVISLATVYMVPIIFSILSHVFFLVNLFCSDDRKEMTKSVLQFIEIDAAIIAVTVLYWVFVETGFRASAILIVMTILLGSGASLCLTWILREKVIEVYPDGAEAEDHERPREESNEETPLLR